MMKSSKKILSLAFIVFLVAGSVLVFSFGSKLSETKSDDKVGFNGDFEIVMEGLPVNWSFYTNKTLKDADFDILPDTAFHHSGKQSLKFDVRDCQASGGRLSPGMSKEIEARPGEVYKVSMWVRNAGAKARVSVGAIKAKSAATPQVTTLSEDIAEWQELSYSCTIPPTMNRLRIELNVLRPGSFWVDDVRVVKQ